MPTKLPKIVDTAANWASNNPTIDPWVTVYESDNYPNSPMRSKTCGATPTAYNSLAYDPEPGGVSVLDDFQGSYANNANSKLYIGASTPPTTYEGSIWMKILTLTPPSALAVTIYEQKKAALTWTNNDGSATGVRVRRADNVVNWDDVVDSTVLQVGDIIFKSDETVKTSKVTTQYDVGSPKTFNAANHDTVETNVFTDLVDLGVVEAYNDTDANLTFDTGYVWSVVAISQGEISASNEQYYAKTAAQSSTRGALIQNLTNLYLYLKFTEASGSLADSSGNSRTFTVTGTPTYQAAGLETSDNAYALSLAATDLFSRTEALSINQPWYTNIVLKGTPIGDRAIIDIKDADGNSRVKIGSLNVTPYNTTRIFIRDNAGATVLSNVGTSIILDGSVHTLGVAFDPVTNTLTVYVDDVQDVQFTSIDLSGLSGVDLIECFNNIAAVADEFFMTLGSIPSVQERADIQNTGTYA